MKTLMKVKTLSSVLLMFLGMFKWIINIICRIFLMFLSFSMLSEFSLSFEKNENIKSLWLMIFNIYYISVAISLHYVYDEILLFML